MKQDIEYVVDLMRIVIPKQILAKVMLPKLKHEFILVYDEDEGGLFSDAIVSASYDLTNTAEHIKEAVVQAIEDEVFSGLLDKRDKGMKGGHYDETRKMFLRGEVVTWCEHVIA